MKFLVVATLLVGATVAQAATPAMSLSFHELVKHPAKYNGKRVSVRAYLVTSCHHCGDFYADVACARQHRAKHGVAIGRLVKESLMAPWPRSRLALATPKVPNDGFVHVTGTFRWNDTSRPVPKETEHVRYIREGGFGWMGNRDKTITDITEYRPIGGHVPAGIN